MTRFQRKNRTDIIYKGCGGITDAFDDVIKDIWRINDDEYDYLCEVLTDDEINYLLLHDKSISAIKQAIKIINIKLEDYENT